MENKSKKLTFTFLIYWLVLIIWQNFLSYSTESATSFIIKLGLLTYLVFQTCSLKMRIGRSYALLWFLYSLLMLRLLFAKDDINGSTLIYYLFPVIFSFVIYVGNTCTCITTSDYYAFLKLYILAVFFMAIYALVFQNNQLFNISSLTSAYGYELKSFFISSHEYGMYLTFGIISIVILLLKEKQTRFSSFIYLMLMLLFGWNLIATISRTAILSCIVNLFVVALLSKKNFIKKSIIAIVAFFVVLVFISPEFVLYINNVILKGGNDAGRFIMWSRSWVYFEQLPLMDKIFGNGISSVTAYVGSTYSHSSLHNAFLQTLLVSGVIGDCFLILVILESIIKSLKLRRIDINFTAIFISMSFTATAFMFTNTACIMQSPIDSFLLTVFCIVMPRFVTNSLVTEN